MYIIKYLFLFLFFFSLACSTENKVLESEHTGELGYECKVNNLCDTGLTCSSENKCISISDLCKNITCLNHGKCRIDTSGETPFAICDCDTGYINETNFKCISSNICLDIICSNNGNCYDDNGIAKCNCKTGYSPVGTNCIKDDCTPKTCSQLNAECGNIDNGCGVSLDCGTCSGTDICNTDTKQCEATCTPKTCSQLNAECGNIDDTCGSDINCGICSTNEHCSNNSCFCDTNFHLESGNCVANGNCYNVTCDSWKECNETNGDCELIAGRCDMTSDCNNSNLICSNHYCINPCEPITCSNHGDCELVHESPICNCDDGYYQDGLNCLIIPISKTFYPNSLRLNMGETVELQQSSLNMQSDGNLVLYDTSALWETDTNTGCSNCNYFFRFQADGNLVVYNASNQALWASGTNRMGVHHLTIDNEKLGLYDNYGNIIWNSICTTGNLDSGATCTLGPEGNKIEDSRFKLINYNINNQNIHGGGVHISPNWILKTQDDNLIVSTTNISDGVQVNASYSSVLGYLYIRQIIPNVFQFENKTITLEVEYTNNSEQNLDYDVYIQARFNPDNTTRILVADTSNFTFATGSHTAIHTFNVPDFGNKIMEDTEGLSVAFRVIAQNKTADFKIHAYRVIIHGN